MDTGSWVQKGSISVDGVNYVVYQHSALGAELLVQQGVSVTLPVVSRALAQDVSDASFSDVNNGSQDVTVMNHDGNTIGTPMARSDSIDATQNTAATVSGKTEGVEDGQRVTITFTDSANHQVTASATVSGGKWSTSADNLSTLTDGDTTSGHGVDQVNGFTLGVYGETPNASRIDLSQLLTGYTPAAADGPAHYVDGKATIDAGDTIEDYLKVRTENGNTVISIDRDGAGTAFAEMPLVMLNGVSTDLATLLADHQIVVSHGEWLFSRAVLIQSLTFFFSLPPHGMGIYTSQCLTLPPRGEGGKTGTG
jgi:hypothetical protein